MAAKKKKAVIVVDIPVKLTQEELDALQNALESSRKPSVKVITGYFAEIIDEKIEQLVADFPPDEPEDDEGYA